jgi:hypothetical protein
VGFALFLLKILCCNLEDGKNHDGNLPPSWRNKIITVETFLQSGGTKSSRWKPSSKLEEQNHHDGNLPPIWRNKIIAMETFLQSGGTKSSQFWGKTSAEAKQKSLTTAKS